MVQSGAAERSPTEFIPIPIPDGVGVCSVTFEDNETIHRFGVTERFERDVPKFERRSFGPPYVPGTIIMYMPGWLRVWVKKQSLSPEEINRIGSLSSDLNRSSMIDDFLGDVSKRTEGLTKDLTPFILGRQPSTEFQRSTDDLIADLIADFGIILEKIKSGRPQPKARFDELVMELDRLGIALIDSEVSGDFPISILARDRRNKQTEIA